MDIGTGPRCYLPKLQSSPWVCGVMADLLIAKRTTGGGVSPPRLLSVCLTPGWDSFCGGKKAFFSWPLSQASKILFQKDSSKRHLVSKCWLYAYYVKKPQCHNLNMSMQLVSVGENSYMMTSKVRVGSKRQKTKCEEKKKRYKVMLFRE